MAEPDNTIPIFSMKAKEDVAASRREGRPIFKEVPYVEILIPGSRDRHVAQVTEQHKQRWPNQWAAFENRREEAIEGTPIEEWPQITVAQVATMRALKIRTVENLAHLNDSAIGKLGPGGRELVNKAKRFIEFASASSDNDERLSKLEAENAELRRELQALRESAPPKKRGPGRPRKQPADEPQIAEEQEASIDG